MSQPQRRREPSSGARALLLLAACAALLAACGGASTAPGEAQPGTCGDGVRSAGEADVDCGGPCAPCADGKACSGPQDCAGGICAGGACAPPSCTDGVRNGDETDVDCGGSCGACAPPSCTDGVRNGDETGVDCGGATCPGCGSGAACSSPSGCATGVCLAGSCDCGDLTGVYVSAVAGDDANPGTAAAPLRTIQAAVACAYEVPREIRVAEGVYEGSDSSRIALLEGKSLVGGWSADFGVRSPADHPSELRDTTDTGTSGAGVAVYLSSTSTATVLDGFTIQATTLGAGIRATAISVSPPPGRLAGATIRGNVIRCGGNAGIFMARCIDLGTSGGSIVVEGNAIHLGASDPTGGTSWGIHGYGVSAVEIGGNLLDGGSSAAVVPIELWVAPSGSPVVAANDVRPGAGADAGVRVRLMSSAATPAIRNNVVVVAGGATGIDDGAGAEISNNTIVAATGAGIRTSVSGAELRNNAVTTEPSGTCLDEASPTADPASVRNNDLYGCGTLYRDGASTPLLSLPEVNALPGASGNVSADPALDAVNGWRPLAGSPLLGAGLDLSSLFQTDKAGAARTPPWSIGAYQAP